MSQSVKAYGAANARSALAPLAIPRRGLRADDVEIEIRYCGVCHSDLHFARNDWGFTRFPVVPGHEIIGRVVGLGAAVREFQIGQTVGVGCMVDACGQCAACGEGHEQYCLEGVVFTYGGVDRIDKTPTHGGYSEKIIVKSAFVLRVPDNLDLAAAAPLLCAGITTWTPLRAAEIGPGKRVAVVGLGGLGHMAIKLAKALGADVTLLTRSPGKEADARRLGADRVIVSTDPTQMASVARQFHLVVDTVPYAHDLNPYLPTLRFNGRLALVGYLGPLEPPLNTLPMIISGQSLHGSLIGGIAATQELLDFCGRHGIVADIETIRMQDINLAYERMLKSDVHYRFVIDMTSIQG